MKAFGSLIRERRQEKGWTQEEVVARLKATKIKGAVLSRQTFDRIEAGLRVPTDSDELIALAEALALPRHRVLAMAGEAHFHRLPDAVHAFVQREMSRRLRTIPTELTDVERQLLEVLRALDARNVDKTNEWRSAAESVLLAFEMGGDDWLWGFRYAYLVPIDLKAELGRTFRSVMHGMLNMFAAGHRRRQWDDVGGPVHPEIARREGA